MLFEEILMDIPRFIQIFIVQGLIGLLYLYMAFKVLRREAKGLNLILSGFYICGGLGVIINIIYAFIYHEIIVTTLHFITYFVLCLSLIFLMIFILMVAKPESKINKKFRIIIGLSFAILLLGLLLIPKGITINSSTNWKPVWSIWFLLYSVILCSTYAIIPTIYYSIKLYNKFEHQELKKRWKYFIIGIFAYFFLYYGTSISNTLADPTFRLIWSLVSIPTLISLYFIYYGTVKQI
ncbi:MAG: hypothetical protein ACFFKA_03175 [Candidatus Thorarchaeota archaeon]